MFWRTLTIGGLRDAGSNEFAIANHGVAALLFTLGWMVRRVVAYGSSGSFSERLWSVRTGCASWPFGKLTVRLRGLDDELPLLTLHAFMIDLLAYLSWLLANIGVPIFTPVALLPLLNFSAVYRDVAADALKATIRHGQLFWVVIAMCASACYELGCAMNRTGSAIDRSLIWFGLLWHGGFMVASAIIVAFSAADAQVSNGSAKISFGERLVIRTSLIFTTVNALNFALSHYSTLA